MPKLLFDPLAFSGSVLNSVEMTVALLTVIVASVDHDDVGGQGREQFAGQIRDLVRGNGDDHDVLAADSIFDHSCSGARFRRQFLQRLRPTRIGECHRMPCGPEEAGGTAADMTSANDSNLHDLAFRNPGMRDKWVS